MFYCSNPSKYRRKYDVVMISPPAVIKDSIEMAFYCRSNPAILCAWKFVRRLQTLSTVKLYGHVSVPVEKERIIDSIVGYSIFLLVYGSRGNFIAVANIMGL